MAQVACLACAEPFAFIVLRPFASLRVLVLAIAAGLVIIGASRLLSRRAGPVSRGLGLLWVLAGVAAGLWPALTVRAITLLVAIHLGGDGTIDIVHSLRERSGRRAAGLG